MNPRNNTINNVIMTLFALLLSLTTSAQWTAVNTGISDLSQGAAVLGASSTHVFSKANAKMFRSSDSGNNWSEITPPITSNPTECGYFFSSKYFAGMNSSTDCIYYTSDNGDNWTAAAGSPPLTTVVRGFLGVSATLFAYTSNKGIYKSTDGGLNWDTANTGLSNLNVITMLATGSKILAATIGGGVFVSSDNGDTWTASNTGIAGGDLNVNLLWKMGSSIYMYPQGTQAYVSSNDGASWSNWTKPNQFGGALGGPTGIYRNGSDLFLRVRHNYFNPVTFSITTTDSVYQSGNEGSSWTNITANLPSNLNGSGLLHNGSYLFTAFNSSSPSLGIYRYAAGSSPTPTSPTTNIHLTESADALVVYPNPCADVVYFSGSVVSVSFTNILGQTLIRESGILSSINTSSLPAGVYFVEAKTKQGNSYNTKLIKK